MTDIDVWQLERRWKESGSTEDEATYLLARTQSGDLDEKWLRLASHAGYVAARKAMGNDPPLPASGRWADLDPWVTAFSDWGVQAAGVAALAAVEVAWSSWERHFTGIPREAIEAWLQATHAWLACPCEAHQHAASTAITTFSGKLTEEDVPTGGGYILDAAAAVARHVSSDGSATVRLPIANARHGPDGRITDEVLGGIRDKVGHWALYDRDSVSP